MYLDDLCNYDCPELINTFEFDIVIISTAFIGIFSFFEISSISL